MAGKYTRVEHLAESIRSSPVCAKPYGEYPVLQTPPPNAEASFTDL